jgi:hypothetical protein
LNTNTRTAQSVRNGRSWAKKNRTPPQPNYCHIYWWDHLTQASGERQIAIKDFPKMLAIHNSRGCVCGISPNTQIYLSPQEIAEREAAHES